MISGVFIYQPKSGDRVFTQQTTREIGVVKWENGCRHVVGGVHLWWNRASCAWRIAARVVLKNLVEAFGGVAWDDRGEFHAVLPAVHAFDAYLWLDATWTRVCAPRRADDREAREIEAQLVSTGAAGLKLCRNDASPSSASWIEVERRTPVPQPQLGAARVERVVADDGYRFEVRVPAGTMANGDAVEVAIRAPTAWFPLRWQHLGRDLRLDLPAAPAEEPTAGGLEEIRPSE